MNAVVVKIIMCCCLLFIPDSLSVLKTNLNEFRRILRKAKHLLIITGAGVSVESGIPTNNAMTGLWRNKSIHKLITTMSFSKDPATVWEYYHSRRELVFKTKPNAAHFAIAECERWFKERGSNFTLITTNIDGLHKIAGSQNVIEAHGSVLETKCTVCEHIEKNLNSPICPALKGTETISYKRFIKSNILLDELPHCNKCGGLLRPNVIWNLENLDKETSEKAWAVLDHVDVGMIIGFSSIVLPVGIFGSHLLRKGAVVADFNIRKGPYTETYHYYINGKAADIVPRALDRYWERKKERGPSWQLTTTYDESSVSSLDDGFYSNSVFTRDRSFSPFDRKDFKNEVAGINSSREESYSSDEPEIKGSSLHTDSSLYG